MQVILFEIRDGQLFVNGTPQKDYPGIQNTWKVVTNGNVINPVHLRDIGINSSEVWYDPTLPGYPQLPLTNEMLLKVESLVMRFCPNMDVYPPDYPDSYRMLSPFVEKGWTKDNYGPIWIPAKE